MFKKIVHRKTDEAGNEVRVYKDPVRLPHVLDIRLFIKAERKERKLGIVNKETRTLHIVRDRVKHLHFVSNSYGFNYMLLSEGISFDTVDLRDQIAGFEVPKSELLKEGKFLFFRQKGFERQIFVPLSFLDKYCISEKLF